ncbi:MAG: hydratase [Clostridium sp.]|jgi:aconitate hydratase|nr:hydratase [Clostridium sp.]
MVKLFQNGAYFLEGIPIPLEQETRYRERLRTAAEPDARTQTQAAAGAAEETVRLRNQLKKNTIAYGILKNHDTSGKGGQNRSNYAADHSKRGQGCGSDQLKIRFDKLISHDITFVGIIQTARASGLTRFPVPYVLTNCHNSLCAVGGTINEDDHMFGLSCAKHYGGVYVPPHQAVIHQYAREVMAESGGMILGSDSHTRYGALGTMAMGEGGPELVKQLLNQTYDISMPEVVGVYLTGEPVKGVGPQDVALAIIKTVFANGYVKNKVMEFIGPGISKLSADFRIGIDVMTTETTCLSSIWETDEKIREFYEIHGRGSSYRELRPKAAAYYDGMILVDLSAVRPMIALPFHPSNAYPIEELNANLPDILEETQERARISLGEAVEFDLKSKVKSGKLLVDQGIIAGCAGGGFENICAAADILKDRSIGSDVFTLSVYPASMPIYMELMKNGNAAVLLEAGAVLKTAFCGPCFGAGDTPANQAFSIRHSTRNFPNREGSKLQNGQISSVALMDARSIAATAANQGILTPATEFDGGFMAYPYYFDGRIYANRVFDSKGKADPDAPLVLGPNIKDWPVMAALPQNLVLRVASEIHDPVTTTDELIPSGETSSYRSNPLGLAEFTLSRKDPAYVGLAKEMRKAQEALQDGKNPAHACPGLGLDQVLETIRKDFPQGTAAIGFGSVVFAVKPGDGSAREQAASCQKVLGGWANIACEYATKRYRSNLINWGLLPFLLADDGRPKGELPFQKLDFLYFPQIRKAVEEKQDTIRAYVIGAGSLTPFTLTLGELTPEERRIILAGCLINDNRAPGKEAEYGI